VACVLILSHRISGTRLVANVRDVAALDNQFVASVAEHGVLTPVTAVRRGDTVEVTDGQRRTLAARQVGLATLPVYVRDVTTLNEERAVEQGLQRRWRWYVSRPLVP
jgi:ParB family transcriptional regulator, chromosome partitioning protein